MLRQRYRAHGLIFDSAIVLADLTRAPEGSPADAVIDLGDLSRAPDGVTCLGSARYSTAQRKLWFELHGIGRFEVDPLGRIVIDPDAEGLETVLPILTGSVFAAFGAMRGRVPLHAGCVFRNDAAFAFTGESGVGKSTLAAALSDRGYTIYSDDLVLIDPKGLHPCVSPGLIRMKLWKDAAERLGHQVSHLERVALRPDKYFVPIDRHPSNDPIPMRALYWLENGPDGSSLEIQSLQGLASLNLFISQIYRRELLRVPGVAEKFFPSAAAIVRCVPCFRLRRPRSIESLASVVTRLTEHFEEVVAVAASSL